MKEEIKIPAVGESITSGVIVAWLKQNGDFVQDGDILFELETDKAVLEIPSTGSGTLEIVVEAASEVSIGQTVAFLDAGDAAAELRRQGLRGFYGGGHDVVRAASLADCRRRSPSQVGATESAAPFAQSGERNCRMQPY